MAKTVDVKKIMKEIKDNKDSIVDMQSNSVDVSKINKEINLKVAKRMKNKKYAKDVERVSVVKVNNILPKKDIWDNLNYLNANCNIPGFHLQKPGKFSSVVLRLRQRFLLELKYALNGIIGFQNNFNQHVVRTLNGLTKNVENKVAKIEKNCEKIEEAKEVIDKNRETIDGLKGGINKLQSGLESNSVNLRNNNSEIQKIKYKIENINYVDLGIDYKRFEDQHRGSENLIKEKQKQFLRFFHESKEVLDIGCGRGEFIEALHAYGSGAYGIDIDKGMVDACKKKGLNVVQQDAITYLSGLKNEKLDGIFCDQVLEHLDKKDIVKVLKLSYAKLKKGKFAVFSTPNVKVLTVMNNAFYTDPTHITPLHPETLKFLCEEAGFSSVDFIFYSGYTDKEKLQKTKNKAMDKNVEVLNELLFGNQDYAVVCRK